MPICKIAQNKNKQTNKIFLQKEKDQSGTLKKECNCSDPGTIMIYTYFAVPDIY